MVYRLWFIRSLKPYSSSNVGMMILKARHLNRRRTSMSHAFSPVNSNFHLQFRLLLLHLYFTSSLLHFFTSSPLHLLSLYLRFDSSFLPNCLSHAFLFPSLIPKEPHQAHFVNPIRLPSHLSCQLKDGIQKV